MPSLLTLIEHIGVSLWCAAVIYMQSRSVIVKRYRGWLLLAVGKACAQDILEHNSLSWVRRFDAFQEVTPTKMLFSFKKMDSFYPDKWFINPKEHR